MRVGKTWPRWRFALFSLTLVAMVTMCAIIIHHQHRIGKDDCRWIGSEPNGDGGETPPPGKDGSHQMHQVCRNRKCPRALRPRLVTVYQGQVNMSSCDDQATARGPHQKVVAYSLYGDMYSKYFNGTPYNVEAVARMYPGWTMRLYHNLDLKDNVVSEVLCEMWCNNDHLDICDVRQLPSGIGDQRHIFGMIWRFFVMGDPLVERFLIRDIDSVLLQREVDAVQAWIRNGTAWHVMRDHRYHSVPILGGMWGGTNRNLKQNAHLRQTFIQKGKPILEKGLDQDLLRDNLWPLMRNDLLVHDSYCCTKFKGSRPWPTKRQTMEFVGDKFPWEKNGKFKVEECPKECRPKDHADWKYC